MSVLCITQTSVGPYYVTAIVHHMFFSLGLIMINLHDKLLAKQMFAKKSRFRQSEMLTSTGARHRSVTGEHVV